MGDIEFSDPEAIRMGAIDPDDRDQFVEQSPTHIEEHGVVLAVSDGRRVVATEPSADPLAAMRAYLKEAEEIAAEAFLKTPRSTYHALARGRCEGEREMLAIAERTIGPALAEAERWRGHIGLLLELLPGAEWQEIADNLSALTVDVAGYPKHGSLEELDDLRATASETVTVLNSAEPTAAIAMRWVRNFVGESVEWGEAREADRAALERLTRIAGVLGAPYRAGVLQRELEAAVEAARARLAVGR